MATALVTQIAYAVQTLFDPAGTAGRLVDLGKLANYGLLGGSAPTVWLPSELFTAGVNGTWYDPSDLTTLYQDAAGALPVTAVEQPVGLMLDKSKGLVLGSEVVVNGDFSSGSNWTRIGTGGTVSISGGVASITNVAGSFEVIGYSQSIPVASGKTYFVTATYTKSSVNGFARLDFGPTASFSKTATSGTISGYVTATASTFTLTAYNPGNGSEAITVTFDNISVRELPGNHAFNSSGNSANFPVLSARYNLLTKTEDISASDWAAYLIASRTTTKFIPSTGVGEHYIVNSTSKTATAIQYSARFDVKDEGYGFAPIVVGDWSGVSASNGWYFCVNLSDGSYSSPLTFGSGWGVGTIAVTRDYGTGICTVSLVFTTSAVSTRVGIGIYAYPSLKTASPFSFAGDGTSGVYCSKIDLRVANDALNQPAYQRVNTATDYDTVGFKPYLKFNGTNQWLQTNSIDFTYGDKMFVSAGVRRLSDSPAVQSIFETYPGSFNNSFAVTTANSSPYGYDSVLVGTNTTSDLVAITNIAPITNVISTSFDFAGTGASTEVFPRVDGVIPSIRTINAGPAGSGAFGNYPMFVGARAGTSLWFNGRLYQMVVAGKQASAAEITSTETYINQKTGAY